MLRDYIHDYVTSDRSLHWSVICRVMGSPARICMIPMQDYLGLDNTCRINTPSTLGTNWKWRLLDGEFTSDLQNKIKKLVRIYQRN